MSYVANNTRAQKDKKAPHVDEPGDETSSTTRDSPTRASVNEPENAGSSKDFPVSPTSKAVKSIRFKRRIAIGMISRYNDATKKVIQENGSRTAIRKNRQDILTKLNEIEDFHVQLEELLGEDEQIIGDTMILADIRMEVNNITGLIQEHLEIRAGEPSTRDNSEAGSQRSSPILPKECDDPKEDGQLPDESGSIEQQRREESARLSGEAHQKRFETDRLVREAEEIERQSEAIDNAHTKDELLAVLPVEKEISGEEKAALYVQHLESVKELKQRAPPECVADDGDDWIVRFRKSLTVTVRTVDPGKLPVRADVPVYNGDPLKWLSWSGLFKALVHDTKMSSEAKMGFLHTKLSKECDQVIAGLFPDDTGYAEALMLLRDRFGHPTTLQAAHLKVLKNLPPVHAKDVNDLPAGFQSFVDLARSHLAVLSRYSKGESPFVSSLIYELTDKLPQDDAKAWRLKVGEGQVKMTLEAFSTWLGARGRAYWGALPPQSTFGGYNRFKGRRSLHGHQTRCKKCNGQHKIDSCTKFKELSAKDRFNFAKEKRLCFGCLEESHMSRNCSKKKECGKDDCKKRHHPLLHQEENVRAKTTRQPQSGVAFGVVEVSVLGAGGSQVKGNLLFDDGSDTTLVSESFMKKLGLRGKRTTLNISGVGGKGNRRPSSQVTLRIERVEGDTEFVNLAAWSLPTICQPVDTVPWPHIKSRWRHLEDIELKEVGGEIDILLGLDHAELLVPY